jgi:catechol 2,3-dioxygenase-like lactoylglutathione lyase family enzyme
MTPVLKHIALSVADIERSIRFYRDLLGLTLVLRIECPAESKLGEVVALPQCRARIAKLKSGDVVLELFEYQRPRGNAIAPEKTQADHGFSHIGFASSDIHGDYERLRRLGVKFYGRPIEYRQGVWNVYFYGPDGETCELRQAADE